MFLHIRTYYICGVVCVSIHLYDFKTIFFLTNYEYLDFLLSNICAYRSSAANYGVFTFLFLTVLLV